MMGGGRCDRRRSPLGSTGGRSALIGVAALLSTLPMATPSTAALICRPGPAGSQICTEDTTPGQSATAPAYVVIVPYATPPPPLRQPQNALEWRAGLKDYCRQNLSGCGPTLGR